MINFYRPRDEYETSAPSLKENPVCQFYLEPRSLLILKDDLYTKYLHGIEDLEVDRVEGVEFSNAERVKNIPNEDIKRGVRISLTIRNVLKTSNFKIKLGR